MDKVIPLNYEITLEPDLKSFKFNGKEKIKFKLLKKMKKIILNAVDLKIKDCHLVQKKKAIKPKKIKINPENETLEIDFPTDINGNMEMFISFSGILNDKLVGFYRSEYKSDGKKKFLATTQFEASDARRAFPCWDEPEKKATFDISLIVDKNLTAISNMPIASQKRIGKSKKLVRFDRTPKMSTYLVYVGVGEFEFLQDKLGETLIRVVTTRGNKKKGRVALDYAKRVLEYLQNYFGIKYPLPKLDLIAIPDFASGAMENWGAITFRETALLFDPKISSTLTKQTIAVIVSHEIVHQWFGNLVTMKWWNDLWLNESFATFMAFKTVDALHPEWGIWNQFLNEETVLAMEIDSLKSSHPIDAEVKTPAEIREIFDAISYEKGGSILRMLESYLGEEDFRNGLNRYLKSHMYANATTEDLWNSLAKTSRKPVKEMMNSWVRQKGYPIVDVYVENSKLNLAQNKFLLEPPKKQDRTKWLIPISVKINDQKIFSVLLKDRTKTIDLDEEIKSIKANLNQTGFYRVRYSKENLRNLKVLAREKKIGNLDRWGVQNDLFFLLLLGEISLPDYIDFIQSFSEDDDYLVLKDIIDNLSFLYLISFGENISAKIIEFNRRFFKKIFDRLGWDAREGEKHTDKILRSYLIVGLGRLGDGEVLKTAREKFENYLKNPDSLHPDIRAAVFSAIAWNGGIDTYKKFITLYRKSKSPEEKKRFLGSITSFQNPAIVKKALNFSLSKEVRSQDVPLPVARAAGNPAGRNLIWPWIQNNWSKIRNRYAGGSLKLWERVIESLGSLADIKVEKEMREFFRNKPIDEIKMSLEQTKERIRINSKFLERLRRSAWE